MQAVATLLVAPGQLPLQRRRAPKRICTTMAAGTPSSGPGGGKPKPARGPGQAPLRMQTDEQRKLGFGGDDGAHSKHESTVRVFACSRSKKIKNKCSGASRYSWWEGRRWRRWPLGAGL